MKTAEPKHCNKIVSQVSFQCHLLFNLNTQKTLKTRHCKLLTPITLLTSF